MMRAVSLAALCIIFSGAIRPQPRTDATLYDWIRIGTCRSWTQNRQGSAVMTGSYDAYLSGLMDGMTLALKRPTTAGPSRLQQLLRICTAQPEAKLVDVAAQIAER